MDSRGGHGGGHGAMGSNARSSHEQHSSVHKAHDKEAGHLRKLGESVSGAKLIKVDRAAHENSHVWEIEVKGNTALVRWGKVDTAGKSEVRTFPDALLAEKWCVQGRPMRTADASL